LPPNFAQNVSNITWSATVYSSAAGLQVSWQYGASNWLTQKNGTQFPGYTNGVGSPNYSAMKINPGHNEGPSCDGYPSGDHAGAPEFSGRSDVMTGGGSGGGGSNWTGSWSSTPGKVTILCYCSFTPGGWGAPPNGNNIAQTLYQYFPAVYPKGAVIGGSSPYFSNTLTSASAVTTYLPDGGTPGLFTKNYTNPSSTSAAEFGTQVTALQFNVDFSSKGYIKPGFSSLKVASGPLAGLTTTQVLALAEAAVSGNTSVLNPYSITVAQLTSILGGINGNYDNCSQNNGYLK